MNPHHHLDDATIVRYASGDLDEAFAVVVATHLAMCATCREAVHAAEELGGDLLEADGGAALAGDAFERLLGRLDEPPAAPATSAPGTGDRVAGDVPAPLRRYVGNSLDAIRWKTVAPGVRRHAIAVPGAPGSSLYMLHIAPGKAVPEHGHGGSEMTLILSGAYRDVFGRFGRGDIADLDEHVEHQPVVEGSEACICLVATEAPTRFKGVVSRLLQPLIGI